MKFIVDGNSFEADSYENAKDKVLDWNGLNIERVEEYEPKDDYQRYGDLTPTSRLMELELIAFCNVTGEAIQEELEAIDPALAKEYAELNRWDE